MLNVSSVFAHDFPWCEEEGAWEGLFDPPGSHLEWLSTVCGNPSYNFAEVTKFFLRNLNETKAG